MAFLDNSGDIILDAVLTDTGRFRLAKGDGSFKIVKFALGDDEINYGLYDKNHPSGSSFYDLEILQTPVFEAFTNNTSTMHNKLLSIPRTNLLYLPILKINTKNNQGATTNVNSGNNGFVVAVNKTTEDVLTGSTANGVLKGETGGGNSDSNRIRVDQGLDTNEINYNQDLDADLKETQYIIEIDNRLGMVAAPTPAGNMAQPSFIDDDNIASYYLSTSDTAYVRDIKGDLNASQITKAAQNSAALPNSLVIKGPQGTALMFQVMSTLDLRTSNFLFTKLGSSALGSALTSFGIPSSSTTYNFIDTIVKITGATTGYRLDVPVRFIKQA